ncbi:hypothetical protein LTS18_006516 [Coniosporium uncinatum]|uniref:Uncharacterized protein n=1 Tax=Coniosporium uncinatum TaxID=93489 RepID=A0ACC3DQB2_9PEZI|nr:hypothetical protein LTS18_006516 [Coniosporium uncinatum]
MAYVLSLQPQSPLKRSFSDVPCMRSYSPFPDNVSIGTVKRHSIRHVSVGSYSSTRSAAASFRNKENENPASTPSRSLLNLIDGLNIRVSRKDSIQDPARPKWNTSNTAPDHLALIANSLVERVVPLPESADSLLPSATPKILVDAREHMPSANVQDEPAEMLQDEDRSIMSDDGSLETQTKLAEASAEPLKSTATEAAPFRWWISTLRRKNRQRRQHDSHHTRCVSLDGAGLPPATSSPTRNVTAHRASLSESSSIGFVTMIKSASITLASASIAPLSRRGVRAGHLRPENGSSATSATEARMSTESDAPPSSPLVDERAWMRAVQRRKILEELIATEESYIGDIKALINVYFTLPTSGSSMSSLVREALQQTLQRLLRIHEALLSDIQNAVPNAEHKSQEPTATDDLERPKHARWHSVDVVPGKHSGVIVGRRFRHSIDVSRPTQQQQHARHTGITADTGTATEVARVFHTYVSRSVDYGPGREIQHRD